MAIAWDEHKPPELDLIKDCVHCGFCLPTCPSYAVLENENDSPRGRIVLMRIGHDEGAEVSPQMTEHFDNCLGCMACVTACPSGVQYDRLIEQTRPQIERHGARTRTQRAYRRMIFELFTHPGRMRALAPMLALQGRLGINRRLGERIKQPHVRAMLRLAPPVKLRQAFKQMPEVVPARGTRKGRVGFMQGCVQRAYFGDVNAATVRVLAAEGWEVHSPRQPRCCGALMMHSGVEPDAQAFVAKTRDVHELLAEHEPQATRHPLPMTVAYHDACHLAHAQQVRTQPRELLRGIPGLELVEPADWELCCGSAGIYNLVKPEPAAQLGQRKARNLLDTGAEAVVAG